MQKSLGYQTMPHTWLLDVLEGLKSSTNQTKTVDMDFSSSKGSGLGFETNKVIILPWKGVSCMHTFIIKISVI